MTEYGGKKKVLTKEEIAHYEEELGGAYTIGDQLGRSGSTSSAYLLTDKKGNNYVLKIPNYPDKLEEWYKSQEESLDLQKRYVGDYQGGIHVPKTIQKGKDFIVEELAEGKEFFASVYDTLTPLQKKKVARDLAGFLNYSHQRTLTGKMAKTYPSQHKRLSWQGVYDYFSPVLTETEKKELEKEIQLHAEQPEAPEVLAFRDYRFANMLWDDKKERLSIIDFGFTKNGSVYEDFTPTSAAGARISYRFLRDMIKSYNELPKKYPISIDLETVRHNYFLGLYHEYARHNMGKKLPDEDLTMLRVDLKDLKQLTASETLRKTLAKGSKTSTIEKGKIR